MIQQSRDAHSLFLTPGKHVFPFLPGIPAAFAVREVPEASGGEDPREFDVAAPGSEHAGCGGGIDDLVAEGAGTEVGPLGEEHNAVCAGCAGTGDETAVDGPEAGDYAGDGGFAGAVGTGDLG